MRFTGRSVPDFYDQCAPAPHEHIAHLRLDDLDSAERTALWNYKLDIVDGESHCFDLNHRLRNGLALSAAQQATCDGLDSVFARCPRVIKPITIYRGEFTTEFLGGAKVGDKLTCPQFWSTAHTALRTEQFTRDGGAILKLQLPADMAVYDIDTLKPGHNSEQELLLPRGITWQVLKLRQIPEAETPKFLARRFTFGIQEVHLVAIVP